MKHRKSPEMDGILTELLKKREDCHEIASKLFSVCWKQVKVTKDWQEECVGV